MSETAAVSFIFSFFITFLCNLYEYSKLLKKASFSIIFISIVCIDSWHHLWLRPLERKSTKVSVFIQNSSSISSPPPLSLSLSLSLSSPPPLSLPPLPLSLPPSLSLSVSLSAYLAHFSFFLCLPDTAQNAVLLGHILELLTICVERHSYHIRNYVIDRNVLGRVLVLLTSSHRHLVLGK